jgi:hypothetical protein
MSRPPLVRQLTPAQREVAAEAMAVVPGAIESFWRKHPCLRKYRRVIDEQGSAMAAVTLASFCFDPSKSKMTTYYTVAIHNELRKTAMREQRRGEEPAHAHAHGSADKRALPAEIGHATECLDSLDEQARHLVRETVLVGRKVTEVARELGRDPRTLQRRLDAAILKLRECVSSSGYTPSDSQDHGPQAQPL